MKRWMLGFLAVLFSATLAAAQQQPPTPVTPHPGDIPQIVAFDMTAYWGTIFISLAIRLIWASGAIAFPRW